MHKPRGAKADSITLEEFERRMRGGGNGGGGSEEPNVVSRWLRQKGREAVEYKMALLENFNKQSAHDYLKTQPLLKRLGAEFDAIVNREGLEADIAAVKALWHHGFAKKQTLTA
jgi:hypothetical protein